MHTHITVTAPEGRKTPISPNDGVDPEMHLLFVDPGTVCRVRYSADVRRAIARGDLVPCNPEGRPVPLEQAGCPKQLEEHIADHYGGDKCDLKRLKEHREQLASVAKAEAEAKKPETKSPSSASTK